MVRIDDHRVVRENAEAVQIIPADEVVFVCSAGGWDFAVLRRQTDVQHVVVGYGTAGFTLTVYTIRLPGGYAFVSVALSTTFVYALTSAGDLFQFSRDWDQPWTSLPGPVRKIVSVFEWKPIAYPTRYLVCLALLANGDLVRLGQDNTHIRSGVDDVFGGGRSCVTVDYTHSAFDVIAL
jgi:hypothetical protein